MKPRDTKTHDDICDLKEDNTSTDEYWFLLSPNGVTIANQESGEECQQMIKIPRKDFDKLIDWYNREQK